METTIGKVNKNKYPLRKVVERIDGSFKVKLECGHLANPSTDMYGETNPVRQRCRECYKNNLTQEAQ